MTVTVESSDNIIAGLGRSTMETTPTSAVRVEARRAFGWSLLNSVASRFATVVVGLVLARLLVPQEYGVFAVGILVLTVLQSMNELGVSVAVVQWQGEVGRAARTATTLAVGTSVLLYTAVFLAAPPLASFIGAPDAVTIIRLLAVGVVIDGVSSIPGALMTRAFLQRRRAAADLISIIPSSIISVGLAVTGHGAVSLAWGALAGSATATVMILVLAPARPPPGWSSADARRLLRVGLPLAGTSLVLLATLNLDYVIVGRTLGTTALGFYLLAFNLSSWPSNLLSIATRRVAIPGFARLAERPADLESAFADSIRSIAAIGFAFALPLAVLADGVVGVVYGSRWHPAAAALTFLALLGGLRIMFDLGYDLLAAVGRSSSLLLVQIAWFLGLLIALPVGASVGGIEGVGVAHLVVACGVAAPLYGVAIHRTGISIRASVAGLAPVAVAALACVASILLGQRLGLGPRSELVVLGGVSLAVYVTVLAWCPTTRSLVVGPAVSIRDRVDGRLRGRGGLPTELASADDSLKVVGSPLTTIDRPLTIQERSSVIAAPKGDTWIS